MHVKHALMGLSMRRSRAYVVFGWFLTVLAVATVSARSQAAGKDHDALPHPAASHGHDLDASAARSPRWKPRLRELHQAGRVAGALPSDTACPPDMVEVEGDYCPYVEQRCLRWLDPATKLQCAEFDKPATVGAKCTMKTQHKHFCIDRYEWPNKPGDCPRTWRAGTRRRRRCEAIGKRLCGDTEWTLACEGPERLPYPYGDGYARDATPATSTSRTSGRTRRRSTTHATSAEELARLDQREPSRRARGLREPVRRPRHDRQRRRVGRQRVAGGKPYQSGLKGGYWGPVRTRCRPMTTAHDETFRYYQIGFRCCDAAHQASTSATGPAGLALSR